MVSARCARATILKTIEYEDINYSVASSEDQSTIFDSYCGFLMKIEEMKKAARSGYDIDILPPDLITYSKDAAALLADLQSRNERMFLLTFIVLNVAPTRQRLENDIFTVSGIAQKYNCSLRRLEFLQEQ